ncbi:DEAD/DEAH box helicase family protein [Bacillus sp. MUM 13]|uniref:DEAD/DEAH box helicase family protein n=1 Tax=Bacillus sp. MUM 13 TaxID=1678001 RepID=UPI0008F582F9|nr:DEAD/DEAH box helicase family protein [Bacillus sp. MUM 13]OIK09596.1 DNA helicase [Bacillus sp. MUM 13]
MSEIELITNQLGQHILKEMKKAEAICILTSFNMKSGVSFLKEALKEAAVRGADIKICTGDYLYITQPEALKSLLEIDENLEIRLWKSNGVSFHPKAYLFRGKEERCFVIGSSNLSRSALSNGVEWNLSVADDSETYSLAEDKFLDVFYSNQTVGLNAETLKQYESDYNEFHRNNHHLARAWTETEEKDLMLPKSADDGVTVVKEDDAYYNIIKPRFAQIEALEELEKTREEEYNKALVVMATGLGKTYLAAFFAKNFKRILFIAHREEILHQAKNTFRMVMPDKSYGLYNGSLKEHAADVIFASIYTLSLKPHLGQFSPDSFDLIVVDEFHHAAAASYQRVLNYFKPQFLLGITATPDRNDNKDVYAICDGNIAYKIDFLEAIKRQWLSPFRYYGIYDETDYSGIKWLGNKYDEQQLLQVQLKDEMAQKILNAWKERKQTRTIGFCSSIVQADYLSSFFNRNGYKTASLHSKQLEISRGQAIRQLEDGELDAIFTVDLFNEGVDIPSVDTLLFARPTESLTVFTQQIGRGLRLHKNKEKCVIVDLIGNYRNADVKLSVFDTEGTSKQGKVIASVPQMFEFELDLKVIDLLKEMKRKRQPHREQLLEAYVNVKQDLGRRPSYLELHLHGIMDSRQYKKEFQSYYGFLDYANELSPKERAVYKNYQNWLKDIENNSMTKSYKMVVILAMLDRGIKNWDKPLSPNEAAPFFHRYLTEAAYRKQIDFADRKDLWEYNEKKISKLIETMPMNKWTGNSAGFKDGYFTLNFSIEPEDLESLYTMTKDICEYRLHMHFERKGKMLK